MMELEFGGKTKEPEVRWLSDMADVIYDRKWMATAQNFELYYMYRDLYLSRADRDKLMDQGLRYDITIIPPHMLGCEYVKTAGHYHPRAPGAEVSYPELYEVLEGEALYLLQKRDMSDVVVINASAGDKVMVPPDYGHITINWSNKHLKMSNFVARDFSSLYEPIKEKAGGAYYYTTEGWIKNDHYAQVPKLRRIEAPDSAKLKRLGLTRSREMYPLLKEADRLDYLVHPGDHLDLFEGLLES
ncbi:MAG TPA: glucose-6-phosphate isomerase family protein [Methanotrichaceae archaeon]|nr:glucose-6-phosphate isomerase family protein [Methanotrichaceae archaeon]